jgi:hypothetical protein
MKYVWIIERERGCVVTADRDYAIAVALGCDYLSITPLEVNTDNLNDVITGKFGWFNHLPHEVEGFKAIIEEQHPSEAEGYRRATGGN